MINQSKLSIQPNSKTMLDLLLGLGIVVGGVVALLGVWLWLDYHSNPANTVLASISLNLAGWLPLPWGSWLRQEAEVLGLPLSTDTKAYWYMARAGGLA